VILSHFNGGIDYIVKVHCGVSSSRQSGKRHRIRSTTPFDQMKIREVLIGLTDGIVGGSSIELPRRERSEAIPQLLLSRRDQLRRFAFLVGAGVSRRFSADLNVHSGSSQPCPRVYSSFAHYDTEESDTAFIAEQSSSEYPTF